eukprot:gene9654-422_t
MPKLKEIKSSKNKPKNTAQSTKKSSSKRAPTKQSSSKRAPTKKAAPSKPPRKKTKKAEVEDVSDLEWDPDDERSMMSPDKKEKRGGKPGAKKQKVDALIDELNKQDEEPDDQLFSPSPKKKKRNKVDGPQRNLCVPGDETVRHRCKDHAGHFVARRLCSLDPEIRRSGPAAGKKDTQLTPATHVAKVNKSAKTPNGNETDLKSPTPGGATASVILMYLKMDALRVNGVTSQISCMPTGPPRTLAKVFLRSQIKSIAPPDMFKGS